jgi:hypothetical protein
MSHTDLALSLLSETFAICRLGPEADIPSWALDGDFFSVTRTQEELSLVCLQEKVPEKTRCEKDFRCFKVGGPLDFSLTGILSSLTIPLAQAGISVLADTVLSSPFSLVPDPMLCYSHLASC